jgi:3-phenylpropionate/trans-cinnamate dioxygenase ferredoxin reductase component
VSPARAQPRHVVVVGAGQAGVQVAESLRTLGFDGAITLLGAEPHGPYHRPPLSKAWLTGEVEAGQLVLRAPEALARKEITLRCGTTVTSVDPGARTVTLAGGQRLRFSGLALATGARPRLLPLPGAAARGVAVLRTRDDASAVAAALGACARLGQPLVVIGGGFIGLEVAAAARQRGIGVTVLEAQPRLLARALPPVLSDWYAGLHREHGAAIILNAGVAAVTTAGGTATGVALADGRWLPAGLVLIGVGAEPDDRLARAAGLACDGGVLVDACGRTSDPAVVAAGDCTATRLGAGPVRRLESVQNAVEQGRAAAAALVGQDRPFTAAPWFWSQQYGAKLQLAGLAAAAGEWVVRGDLAAQSFSVFGFGAGRLAAVASVNAPRDHLLARKLLDAGVSPDRRQAADPGFGLAALLG